MVDLRRTLLKAQLGHLVQGDGRALRVRHKDTVQRIQALAAAGAGTSHRHIHGVLVAIGILVGGGMQAGDGHAHGAVHLHGQHAQHACFVAVQRHAQIGLGVGQWVVNVLGAFGAGQDAFHLRG